MGETGASNFLEPCESVMDGFSKQFGGGRGEECGFHFQFACKVSIQKLMSLGE